MRNGEGVWEDVREEREDAAKDGEGKDGAEVRHPSLTHTMASLPTHTPWDPGSAHEERGDDTWQHVEVLPDPLIPDPYNVWDWARHDAARSRLADHADVRVELGARRAEPSGAAQHAIALIVRVAPERQ